MSKTKTLLVVFLLIAITCSSPIVKAQATETFTGYLYIRENPNINYTNILNIANISDEKYTNYNATIKPFLENNTDIQGRTISNLCFPYIYNLNTTNSISTGQFFRLDQDLIMSGISEFWVRLPIENLTGDAIINARLYRSWISGLTFNASLTDYGEPIFNQSENIKLIYNVTESITNTTNYYYDYIRTSNLTILNQTLNFTWFKFTAPILPKDNYFMFFNITNINNNVRICFTGSDFGNDDLYNSWVKTNTNNFTLEIDLDSPFVCINGLGQKIAGAECPIIDNTYYRNYWVHNKSVESWTTNATGEYLNYIFPFYTNKTVNVTFGALVYDNSTGWATAEKYFNVTGRDFIVGTFDISAYLPRYIDHITFYAWVNSTNATDLKIYTEVQDEQTTPYINTINYFYNGSGTDHRFISEYGGMAWYGYLALENSFWSNTEIAKSVVIEFDYDPFLEVVNKLCKIVFGVWGDTVVQYVTTFFGWYFTEDTQGKAIKSAAEYLYEKVGVPLLNLMRKFGNAFMAFGTLVWKVITGIVDAIVWLGYLVAKLFYSVIVMLVYFICISSVFLVCEAVTVYLKKWPKPDFNEFQKEINRGWPRLYFMINTLFSVLMLLFVIINSIYNFIKVW